MCEILEIVVTVFCKIVKFDLKARKTVILVNGNEPGSKNAC